MDHADLTLSNFKGTTIDTQRVMVMGMVDGAISDKMTVIFMLIGCLMTWIHGKSIVSLKYDKKIKRDNL